jgi:hypothetical protein
VDSLVSKVEEALKAEKILAGLIWTVTFPVIRTWTWTWMTTTPEDLLQVNLRIPDQAGATVECDCTIYNFEKSSRLYSFEDFFLR